MNGRVKDPEQRNLFPDSESSNYHVFLARLPQKERVCHTICMADAKTEIKHA